MKKTDSSSRRGRPRQFNREQALQKALELFWAHGYEGTSIAELVEALGIAPPSLYAAFGSKEELFLEALRLYLQGPGSFVARALEEEPTAFGFLRRTLLDAAKEFSSGSHPRGCVIATGLIASANAHRKLAEEVAALRSASSGVFEQRFVQGQQAGELPGTCRPAMLARFYAAIIQGMAVQARDGADETTLRSIAELALERWPGPTTTLSA
jgi:AcrR family transcriptional regulator